MQWLFPTCHNYWIVCHLVRDDNHLYLSYSPEISIEDSSEPFEHSLVPFYLLSSTCNPDMEFDTIEEEADNDPLSDDGSRLYQGSSGGGADTGHLMSCEHAHGGHEDTELKLMVHMLISITWLAHSLSGYFILPQIIRILTSMGASLHHGKQHPHPSRVH